MTRGKLHNLERFFGHQFLVGSLELLSPAIAKGHLPAAN
jgi:hypothetical protein